MKKLLLNFIIAGSLLAESSPILYPKFSIDSEYSFYNYANDLYLDKTNKINNRFAFGIGVEVPLSEYFGLSYDWKIKLFQIIRKYQFEEEKFEEKQLSLSHTDLGLYFLMQYPISLGILHLGPYLKSGGGISVQLGHPSFAEARSEPAPYLNELGAGAFLRATAGLNIFLGQFLGLYFESSYFLGINTFKNFTRHDPENPRDLPGFYSYLTYAPSLGAGLKIVW